MFLTAKRSGYDRNGEQVCSGRFLVMMQPKSEWIDGKFNSHTSDPIRCLVRFCAMRQFGNFMMGFIRVKGQRLTVSGSYGSDGLPMDVPREIYELGVELPAELREAWNKGGGWNSAGSEAPAIRAWAKQTFKDLTHNPNNL